jgi:hypothetical protein
MEKLRQGPVLHLGVKGVNDDMPFCLAVETFSYFFFGRSRVHTGTGNLVASASRRLCVLHSLTFL